jgi:hypothetical protein
MQRQTSTEVDMKRGERILILAAAVLLAVAGFNLIAVSPSLDFIRANRPAHYEIVVIASSGARLVPGIPG